MNSDQNEMYFWIMKHYPVSSGLAVLVVAMVLFFILYALRIVLRVLWDQANGKNPKQFSLERRSDTES